MPRTLTGSLTGTSGAFTNLSVNGESVSTPMGVGVMLNAYLPKTRGTLSGGLSCPQFNCTNDAYTGALSCTSLTVNGQSIMGPYLPLSGGSLTGNLSCQQLTCTSEVDTGSLACSNLTLTGSVTLPTSYSSAPGSGSLGYMIQTKNSTAVSMNYQTWPNVCSITLPAGVWMVFGVAAMFLTSSTFVQGGISTSTTTLEDFTYLQQYQNTSGGVFMNVPMRYYWGNGTTLYLNGLIGGGSGNANTGGYSSSMRAVRVA